MVYFRRSLAVVIVLLLVGFCAQAQEKCVYQKIQILVPGEEPAPDTASGRTGVPETQIVGVPFQVRVRVCDNDWNTYPGVTHVVGVSSSDVVADLPADTPLDNGELTTWVTLNTAGDFTLTARDLTDGEHKEDTSAPITVVNAVEPEVALEISTLGPVETAGEAAIVTLSTRFDDGSLDTSRNGAVYLYQLTSLGQGVLSPETVTLVEGQWTGTVTFYLADPEASARLKAVMPDDGLQGLGNYFDVGPGPYARLLVIAPGQNWTPWLLGGLNGTPDRQWADEAFAVDVHATDEYWNRVDIADEVKLDSGDPEADTPLYGSLVGGHRRFAVTMRTPGDWFLAVGDPDQPEIGGMVSLEVPVSYSHLQILLPGETAAPGTATGKTGEPLPQVAGVPFSVTLRACNADFETVPADDVIVRLGSTDYTADIPAAAHLQNGELALDFTFNASGTFTIDAEDISGPDYYSVTSPPVSVSGSTGIVAAIEIETIGAQQTAGIATTVTMRAVDAAGEQVHAFSGDVRLEQMTSFRIGRLDAAQVVFDGGAWAGDVTFHIADDPVHLHAVSAVVDAITGTSNTFAVVPGPASRLLVVLPGQYRAPLTESGLLGGPAAQTTGYSFDVELLAADRFWNRAPIAAAVRLESQDPAASTPVDVTLTDGGILTAITFGTAGNWTLTASADGLAPMTTVPVSVLSSAPDFFIVAPQSPVTAGEPVTVTIRTHGPGGELLDGYNGFAMLAADTGPQTISPATIQFVGGIWTGDVTFFGAAEQTALSCIDFAQPPNIGTSETFEVLPGAFAGLQVLLPGQTNVGGRDPGFTGEPVEQEAGQPLTVVIRAVDSWWNPVPDIDAAIEIETTDPYAIAPRDTNLTGGRLDLEMTFLRAGEHTITATADSVAGYTSDMITVLPGPYRRIIALAPGEELLSGSEEGKAGLALDQSISYSFVMLVLATDEWWNPVTGVGDLIELICTDDLADLPATFSLVDGRADLYIRLSTAGYQLMTLNNLSDPEIPAAHTQMRAIESGFHVEAEIHPDQVIAGEPFTLSVRVVNDAGAVMQDINGFANVAALHAVTQEPGEGELYAAEFQFHQGVRSITQTYTRAEPIVLLVTSESGGEPGLTNVLTIVPGEPASLGFHETADWVGGRKTTDINARVADELGNGVPGIPVVFSLVESKAALEILNEVTNDDGVATARYTGADEPWTDRIRVTAAGFANSMEITTSLMDPGSKGGTISNYPNPFHPGDGGTTVTWMLDNDAVVKMRLFTLSGTLVLEREYAAGDEGGTGGINEVTWDGRNGEGDWVASGGYILFIEAERLGETIHTMRRRIGVVR